MSSSPTDPRDANWPPFRPYAIITAPANASWYTERSEWARIEPVTTWAGIYVWDRDDQEAHEEGESIRVSKPWPGRSSAPIA